MKPSRFAVVQPFPHLSLCKDAGCARKHTHTDASTAVTEKNPCNTPNGLVRD